MNVDTRWLRLRPAHAYTHSLVHKRDARAAGAHCCPLAEPTFAVLCNILGSNRVAPTSQIIIRDIEKYETFSHTEISSLGRLLKLYKLYQFPQIPRPIRTRFARGRVISRPFFLSLLLRPVCFIVLLAYDTCSCNEIKKRQRRK